MVNKKIESNGKIYKIEPISGGDEGDIYIGSTTKQYLSQRMDSHRYCFKYWKEGKQGKTTSYDLFDKYGVENCHILLLEIVSCNTKDELLAREGFYIKSMPCVNKIIVTRTHKEYIEAMTPKQKEKRKTTKVDYQKKNKEILKEKKYIYSNRDDIKERRKERDSVRKELNIKITCECGSTCLAHNLSHHKKTIKHQNYINTLII